MRNSDNILVYIMKKQITLSVFSLLSAYSVNWDSGIFLTNSAIFRANLETVNLITLGIAQVANTKISK